MCSDCKGPHAVSARDCPVWRREREREIQRICVEKRISFSGAGQLVEATFPSNGFTPTVSFADRKKLVKFVVCQTDLTWVSSDTPVQTVYSVVHVSGGSGRCRPVSGHPPGGRGRLPPKPGHCASPR